MNTTKPSKYQQFEKWISLCGGEVLNPLTMWEVMRVKALGQTHVVYCNKKGNETWPDSLASWFKKFNNGKHIDLAYKIKSRGNTRAYRKAIFNRDGPRCFFCDKIMPDDDITVEHLISVNSGGKNHINNMALAHSACNNKAGHMSLVEKVKLRDELRKNPELLEGVESE